MCLPPREYVAYHYTREQTYYLHMIENAQWQLQKHWQIGMEASRVVTKLAKLLAS